MACAGDQRLLQYTRLTAAQVAKIQDQLGKLPPLPDLGEEIDVGERFFYLDCVAIVARQGPDCLFPFAGILVRPMINQAARDLTDWDQALRMGNAWCDRMANAFRQPTRAQRSQLLRKIEKDLKKLGDISKDWKSLGLLMLANPRQALSERFGQICVDMFLSPTLIIAVAADRVAMQFDLTRLAFALAAYRADHGSYPAKLADLRPKYVAEIPQDLFIAAELHYQQHRDGYLLYSVGANGKDDGGKGRDDCKAGEDWDDLAVRVPAPK
jgi:hypothetical protein